MIDEKKLKLAMIAGAVAIENARIYHGKIYVRRGSGTEETSEIPYLEAARVLREAAEQEFDVARKGRWIVVDNPGISLFDGSSPYTLICSECGNRHCVMRRHPTYCANCGAKMDGGGKEVKQDDEQRKYVFECPVKPGQKVYFARFNGTTEDEVICVSFYEEDGEIKWEACNEVHEYFGNGTGHPTKWNEKVFATRKEAEKALKERTKNGDQ